MTSDIKTDKNIFENAPRVSVIIPAYNVAEFISETLDSVFSQTYDDFETIVINDGSPDTENLEQILEKYQTKIVYLKQENQGAAVARNTGIQKAQGEIIAFLDGDDIWLPEFLDRQIELLDEKAFGMVYCDALLFGEHQRKPETYMEKAPSSGEVTPETLINTQCNVITSGTIVKKQHLIKAGLFNPNAIRTEDFEMWFSMAKRGVKIGYQKKVLLKYRVRKTGLTGDNIQASERGIRALSIICERNELSESEERARLRQIRLSKSEHELAKGKFFLARENYVEALKHISKADELDPHTKLKVVVVFLKVAPKLTLRLFKKLRAAEASIL